MKRIALYFGIATVLVASCSVQEEDFKTPQQGDVIYYASFEQPTEEGESEKQEEQTQSEE